MRTRVHLLCRSVFIAAVMASSVLAAENIEPGKDGCTGFKFSLDAELKLFATPPQRIAAAGQATQNPPALQRDRLYEIELTPQSQVGFAVKPGKLTVDDGSYAGVLSYVPTTKGVLRVTLNEAAWVDVVANGSVIPSRDHTGSASCRWLHKSVQFDVPDTRPLRIQISGSTTANVRLTLTSGA